MRWVSRRRAEGTRGSARWRGLSLTNPPIPAPSLRPASAPAAVRTFWSRVGRLRPPRRRGPRELGGGPTGHSLPSLSVPGRPAGARSRSETSLAAYAPSLPPWGPRKAPGARCGRPAQGAPCPRPRRLPAGARAFVGSAALHIRSPLASPPRGAAQGAAFWSPFPGRCRAQLPRHRDLPGLHALPLALISAAIVAGTAGISRRAVSRARPGIPPAIGAALVSSWPVGASGRQRRLRARRGRPRREPRAGLRASVQRSGRHHGGRGSPDRRVSAGAPGRFARPPGSAVGVRGGGEPAGPSAARSVRPPRRRWSPCARAGRRRSRRWR